MAHEEAFAFSPVDKQILGQEHGCHHSQSIVHPAGGQQLTHGCVNQRKTRVSLLPGLQILRGITPGNGLGFGSEGTVPGDPGESCQDVLVELPQSNSLIQVTTPSLPLSNSPWLTCNAA